MPIFAPGTPRLALLDNTGTKVKTLWLPMPDQGLPTIEWIRKGPVKELVDGSEAWRQLGWLPQVVMKWSVYDDRITEGWPVGSGDGNRPSLQDLLTLLSSSPGYLKVSPGPAAGGFVVQSWTVSPIGVIGHDGFAQGLQVTFRGGAIQSSMILGTF